jgi:hypothetical protein
LPEATGALGVRVLARVLGSDLARLVDRISAAAGIAFAEADVHAVALHFEAEFAAGVLASLALDPALASRLVSEGFLARLVGFLRAPPRGTQTGEAGISSVGSLDSKVCASLCLTLRRIAAHSEEHFAAVLREGGLEALIRVARAPNVGTSCVVEGMAACGDLILDAGHVATVDADLDSRARGVAWVISVLDSRGASEPALATSCFHLIHAVQVNTPPSYSRALSSCPPCATAPF